MMKKNIYPIYNPVSELIAIPIIISRIFSGKKIKDLLFAISDSAKLSAKNTALMKRELFEKEIEYKDLDNFFALNFKELDDSRVHSFEDKINYCLIKYAEESKSLSSPTNTVVLEESFLKGADKTLKLYFLIFPEKKLENNFSTIFSSEENYNKFISVMKSNSYLSSDNRFDIQKIFLAGILEFLRKNGIIKKVQNKHLIRFLKEDFNFQISESSLSSATPYPTEKSEEKVFNELAKEFIISY